MDKIYAILFLNIPKHQLKVYFQNFHHPSSRATKQSLNIVVVSDIEFHSLKLQIQIVFPHPTYIS